MATLEKELSSLSQSSASSEQQYPFQSLATRPSVGTAISKHRVLSFAIYDLLAVWLPSLIAVACRYPHGLSGRGALHGHVIPAHFGFLLLYSVLISLFCKTQGLYAVSQWMSLRQQTIATVKSIVLATVLLGGFIYLSEIRLISYAVLAAVVPLTLSSMLGWRYFRRKRIQKAF